MPPLLARRYPKEQVGYDKNQRATFVTVKRPFFPLITCFLLSRGERLMGFRPRGTPVARILARTSLNINPDRIERNNESGIHHARSQSPLEARRGLDLHERRVHSSRVKISRRFQRNTLVNSEGSRVSCTKCKGNTRLRCTLSRGQRHRGERSSRSILSRSKGSAVWHG